MEGKGLPLAFLTTSATSSERDQVQHLLNRVSVCKGRGRPKRCPKEIHADRGYDSKKLRDFLRAKGLRLVIGRRVWKDRKKAPGRKIAASDFRWKIESCFSWLQRRYHRLNVRWERRIKYWEVFLQLSLIMTWVNKLILG